MQRRIGSFLHQFSYWISYHAKRTGKMTENKITHVVFDLGNVLIKWDPGSVINQLQRYMPSSGENISMKDILPQIMDLWKDFDRGLFSESELSERLAERLSLSESLTGSILKHLKLSLLPIPVMVDFLKELADRHYVLGCLSNISEPFAQYLESRYEFFNLFKFKLFSHQTYHIKPEPEIYTELVSRFNIHPERTLFIDDMVENIQAAKRMGFRTIHCVDPTSAVREALAIL